jgi:hypothetical protein
MLISSMRSTSRPGTPSRVARVVATGCLMIQAMLALIGRALSVRRHRGRR